MLKQISRAEELSTHLSENNTKIVATADAAVHKVSVMTSQMEQMMGGFTRVVESNEWTELSKSAERFESRINDLLNYVDTTAQDVVEKSQVLQSHIDGWITSGKKLSGDMQTDIETNTNMMNNMVIESDALREKITELSNAVATGFEQVRKESHDYSAVVETAEKSLESKLLKLDEFAKQSKTILTSQVNELTDTANTVKAQIRLAESSMERQEQKLSDTMSALSESAIVCENSVKNIVGEVSVLIGKWSGEVKEFTTGVVSELHSVHGVAHKTLEDTRVAAGAFGESVKSMATGVRETLLDMNAAHEKLTDQSAELVKVSADTTEQLKPLSELIERYYASLPEITKGSADLSAQLSGEIQSLEAKMTALNSAMGESLIGMADSSLKLNNLAGESRGQMIDLMNDYAKAVDTMRALNAQMAEARATAPMKAMVNVNKVISAAPVGARTMSATDFMDGASRLIERLHELSVDLTRAIGAEIPDSVWTKYHAGDKTIFSKWFAKMMNAADKKKVKELFKSDAVFRSQATQFVRGFTKMMAAAEQTDNKEIISATLLKTDLGQMYLALKAYL